MQSKVPSMPPQGQTTTSSWVLYENDATSEDKSVTQVPPSAEDRKWIIVWRNVILMAVLHIGGLYGAYLFLTKAMWTTCLFGKL
ncbi:unnamed protein product [Plutella xylostella]|uniref:(diamondback moth) hypothetical protein n=1 Tax=Plutella xylostella TaxID=51655 RepID=A0A8S4ED63_PLUXY|nr:unnamed protein product [Plutella xylostella]